MFVTIWSKDNCIFCDAAVKACMELADRKKGFKYKILKLNVDFEPEDFSNHFPFSNTVPQVVIDGKHLGGWAELKKELEDIGNKDSP